MLKRLFKSSFLKSLAVLTGGSFIGTIIIAISEVARTWIFPTEYVGIYTFLLTIPTTFISITSLRYDISIVIEEDDRRALSLVKLSGLLSIIVSILVTMGFAFFILIFHRDYVQYLYLTPMIFCIMIGYSSNNILNAYNNRYREYGIISKKYVLRTAAQYLGTIILGLIVVTIFKQTKWSVLIMMVPYGLGLFVGIKEQAEKLLSKWDELKSIDRHEMREAAKKYRRQVYYSTPALFLNSYSFSVITFQIESIFNATTLALYSISNRVLGMPISLISGNVAKVYIEDASREYEKTGKFVKAYKKTVIFLTAVAIPLFLIIYFIAPPVCTKLLGTGWSDAGIYIKILSLMFSFRLVGTAISQSLAVCDKQGWELVVNGSLILASLFSGAITRLTSGDIYFFLHILCMSRVLCYLLLIVLVGYFSKGSSHAKKCKKGLYI